MLSLSVCWITFFYDEFKRNFNLPSLYPPHSYTLDYYPSGCKEAVNFTLTDEGLYPMTFSEMRTEFNCRTELESGNNIIFLVVEDGEQYSTDYLEIFVDCYYMDKAQPAYSLSLFPNPASNVANLEIIENEASQAILKYKDCLVYIIDKNGREFFNIKTKSRIFEIDVANLQEGTYVIITLIGDYKSYVTLKVLLVK